MGAAAGGAGGQGRGVVELACAGLNCTRCNCQVPAWQRRRYAALPPANAQDMLQVPSYELGRDSSDTEEGHTGCGGRVPRQAWGIALSAVLFAALVVLGARAAVPALGAGAHEQARGEPRSVQDHVVAAAPQGEMLRGRGADRGARGAAPRSAASSFPRPRRGQDVPETAEVEPSSELQTSCGPAEDDMCYVLPEVYRVPHVGSAEECCRKCQTFPGGTCLAWTWGRDCKGDCNQTCVLKGAPNYQDEHITKVRQRGVVSAHFQPKPGEVPMLALKAWPDSLFCFALVRPDGPERGLLRLQHDEGWGIFQCEARSFYSSRVFEVAPRVKTSKVDSDLNVKKGGEFGTALNSWVFIAVWSAVAAEGTFRRHDWTVKADPDAVWFPDRLRVRLQEHSETSNGVYLNNCKFGLHGPLEVLSKNAASAYVSDLQKGDGAICVQEQEFGGWGEDMFMDQCLLRHLRVERDNDFNLLCEDHCGCPEWSNCSDSSIVAFHPFKSKNDFRRCMANAKRSFTWLQN